MVDLVDRLNGQIINSQAGFILRTEAGETQLRQDLRDAIDHIRELEARCQDEPEGQMDMFSGSKIV